jgi:ABC-type uncharacterized transport system involved in gliding motility auxiliary subunit
MIFYSRAAGLLIFTLLSCSCSLSPSLMAQSSSSTPSSPVPAPSTTPAPESAASQSDPPKQSAASSKPKHVITNEDLERKSARPSSAGKVITSDNSPLLNCEAACEQQAREQFGYGPDRESEWQLQVVQARRDLPADSEWSVLLGQSIQQLDTYCTFVAQASQVVSPSGNDFRSRTARAKADQYFENMDRTLRQNLQSTFSRMQSHVQDVSALYPVRAALMYVQANRIIDRSCEALGSN